MKQATRIKINIIYFVFVSVIISVHSEHVLSRSPVKYYTDIAISISPLAAGIGKRPEISETARIQRLIDSLKKLKNAKFIRNGKAYDVREAIDHMTKKWKWKKDQIKTAKDFIKYIGTKSSMSGKYYMIKTEEGKMIKLAEWFNSQIAK